MRYAAILGGAGTGKSFTLRERAKDNPMYARLTATTGIAAINLGAGVTTINSVLRYFDTASLKEKFDGGELVSDFVGLSKTGYEWLLIDEISMMNAEQLTYICEAAERAEKYVNLKNLGECQVPGLLISGDYLQLPPVHGEFAFTSRFWPKFEEHTTLLTKNYRQDNPAFQKALTYTRHGNGAPAAMALKECGVNLHPKVDEDFTGVTLFPTNAMVDKLNAYRFNKLPGEVEEFESTRWSSNGKYPQEWKQIPYVLQLKEGARVMILTNDTSAFEFVNGDQATVRYFTPTSVGLETDRGLHFELGYITRRVLQNNKPVGAADFPGVVLDGVTLRTLKDCNTPREKAVLLQAGEELAWDNFFAKRPYLDVKTGKWVVGECAYLPVRLAYASTVHKTQGLTLDNVQIDARSIMAGNPAMMYVALSRCRRPESIRIVTKGLGDLARRIVTSPMARRWV
jgi:hypothetical protein